MSWMAYAGRAGRSARRTRLPTNAALSSGERGARAISVAVGVRLAGELQVQRGGLGLGSTDEAEDGGAPLG